MDQAFIQREFTRVPMNLGVRITVAGRDIPNAGSQNISLKGILIPLSEPLDPGTPCLLSIVLAEGGIEIEVEGVVVRTYPFGTAFQFTKILGVDSFDHLRNLVLYNAPDTGQVEEEFHTHLGLKKQAPE